MIIMGLDLATTSGWAVRDSEKHRSTILCGTFTVKEYDWEEKYPVAGNLFYRLLKEHNPHFVAIERPEHGVRQFKKKDDESKQRHETEKALAHLSAVIRRHGINSDEAQTALGVYHKNPTINPNALQLTGIAGAVTAICMMLNIPFGTIAATSWRPIYYGKGVKPGEKEDWKDLAIQSCEREKIKLPKTKAEQGDAAEAVGVCTCWSKCQIPNIEWMQQRFMDLRTGAYEQKRMVA